MLDSVLDAARRKLLRFLGVPGTTIRCQYPLQHTCSFGRGVQIAPTVEVTGWNRIDDGCQVLGMVRLGMYSTLATGVVLHGGRRQGLIDIGRYVQIGPQTAMWGMNHGTNFVTAYNGPLLFGGRMKQLDAELPITVGDGVWIGGKAIVLAGVTIGHMSVIGASAVVTKSVPPYSLVVGNPGRIIRKRFTEEIRTVLDEWKWWQRSPDELQMYEPLFQIDLEMEPDRGAELLRRVSSGTERTATKTEPLPI